MKKTLSILLAAATLLAACTKSEIAYEQPQEIGFNVVAGNITKVVVDGTTYPTGLNMYVNAYTTDHTGTTPNYIKNGEFTYLNTYGNYIPNDDQPTGTTEAEKATNVWGGGSSSSNRNPYYWPNEKNLHFSGFSKSGNVANLLDNVAYNPNTDVLTITGYQPGTATGNGANDLMWFPSTKHSVAAGYGKDTKFVPVSMYHTCAWITIKVKGDATTGAEGSSYTVKTIKINGIDNNANVTCSATNSSTRSIVWSDTTATDASFDVLTNGSVSLAKTGLADADAVIAETNEGNTVLIPQKPGTIDLEWTYKSSTNDEIEDSAKNLSLSIGKDNDGNLLHWLPGYHYIYTITIKANEILIAPTSVDWTEYTPNPNVTVE